MKQNKIKNFIKTAILFLLIGSFTHQLRSQQINKNHQLIYDVDQLKTGAFLHDFMLIGSFPNPLPEGVTDYFHLDRTCLGFSKDYLVSTGGEKNAEPFIGQAVSFGNNKNLIWQNYHSPTDKINLKKVFTPNDKVVAYAAIWIKSDTEQKKLMGIGSNDGMKVWLNGKMLIKVHKPRTVNIDNEYLSLKLHKGKNLLLIKIEQGFGGWGFVLRPVDNATAWKQVQKRLNVSMNSEFKVEGNLIKGTVGDNNIVGQLSGLPMAKVTFKAINGKHTKTIEVPVGTKLELKKSDFPADEYAITISFKTEKGIQETYAYMNTVMDVVQETRDLMYKEILQVSESPLSNYYYDFLKTVQWLDQANKLWEHPYGYRRYLDGIKNAHLGMEKLQTSKNPFDGVFPQPFNSKFGKNICKIDSSWKIFDINKTDDFIAEKLNDFWQSKFNSKPEYATGNRKERIISLEISNSDKIGRLEGSYIIDIKKNKITIKAKSRQGLFYGISTLLQAMEQNSELPTGMIKDKPAFPVRSIIVTKTAVVLNDNFKNYIKQLAGLRYNVAYLPSNAYLHLEDPQKLKDIREIFAFCKAHFMEPVPYFETFGGGTLTRVIDPCLDEGIFHKKEAWTVSSKGIIELSVPKILDCPNTTIHIFTKEGKELKRYKDFKLLSVKKPKILIEDSKLFNTELLLSYDAVDFSSYPHEASCPSDPHGWEIMENVISNVIDLLHPKSLHISQDEVGVANKCSRCLARNLSTKELMMDQIQHVHSIIRKYDSKVNIYMWGDMFNDLQNAPKIGASGCVEGLPKDIKVWDWNYIGVYHSDKMQTVNQMNFYLDKGYETGGVAWFEPANVLDILQTGLKNKDKFPGIMHSAWAGFEHSLYPVAEANWTGKSILGDLKF